MTFAINTDLKFTICESPEAATEKGYVYRDEHKALRIDEVVVVKGGTVQGNSTVDLILIDEDGKKYVTMVTSKLLKAIPSI